MKTEKIYICSDEEGNMQSWSHRLIENYPIEAIVTYNSFEKKIEITESEFDQILDYAIDSADDLKYGEIDELKMILKQRLFSK